MGSFFLIAFGAVGLGFVLIFLLALGEKKGKAKASQSHKPVISRDRFEKACVLIVEGMKLEISEINRSGEDRLDILARNPTPFTGGDFLVHCLYREAPEVIRPAEIIEFSNMVLQERLSKGIFITTGRFTDEIPTIGELAPMEFIDGPAFQKLLGKYAPDYLVNRS